MLELELEAEKEEEYQQPLKKKSTKNQTKPINLSSKTVKSNNLNSSKNQTKLSKTSDVVIHKLNSTTLKTKTKKSNSTATKTAWLDPAKTSGGGKNKTTKGSGTKEQGSESDKNKKKKKELVQGMEDEEGDLVSEFKDLPVKFQQSLIPDLERISTTSKAYIAKANKEMTKGFKPYVGNKYAATVATLLSCAFALVPLLLVSLLFNKIKAYFSLQKLLIFIQAYLAIYFLILSLSNFVTGLEPLRFFYSTSRSTYLCLQVLQTLAYVLYLLLLLMYLVLVFSTDSALASKFLGLAQTFVGFSVGLHYYMTVFHRVVLKQPPKTNWKIHAIYATCFFLISFLAGADTRKKTYLEEGGEEGKKN